MRKILIIACAVTLVGILAGGTCIAGVPGSISYQGKLTDTSGLPVSDGEYPVQFKLYAAGTLFWTSAAQNVTTSGGVFTTQLTPLAASDLAGKTDVWMEIWVGSPLAALSPRTKFTSAPYALISGDSWSLLGNAGTIPGASFLGTTDNQPLEFRVNNTPGFRLEPTSGTPNVIGGYSGNTTGGSTSGATISGGGVSGYPNSVTNIYGTVGGGYGNTASEGATVGGGAINNARDYAAVPGGVNNTALGIYSFAAGERAKANNIGSFVWSDSTTASPNFFASTAANQFLIRATGGVGIGANDPAAALDVNGLIRSRTGGVKFPDGTIQTSAASASYWGLTGNAGTTPGTNFLGTTDYKALEFKVNNTRVLRLECTGDVPNVIGGYSGNTVAEGVAGATISGGGAYINLNSVTDHFGAVGGGAVNTASGYCSTVGGGRSNIADGYYATVPGGYSNLASGYYATVPGGYSNLASGYYSFAAGAMAKAGHYGAFVWSSPSGGYFESTHDNQFLIQAIGGVGIRTNDPQYTLHVNGSVAGVGPYHDASDLRYKTNIEAISNALGKVMGLRGVTFDWRQDEYKDMSFEEGRHVGLIAQEVEKVLPEVVSKDGNGVYSVAYGSVVPVLVEAMKEQNARLDRLESENGSLQRQIDDLKKLVAALVSREQEKP